jgi:hypothetical protein
MSYCIAVVYMWQVRHYKFNVYAQTKGFVVKMALQEFTWLRPSYVDVMGLVPPKLPAETK